MNSLYFDKSVIYGVNGKKWTEFWRLASQKGVRGYYTPITYVEIASGLFKEFRQNKRCFKLIVEANLDILEHPEICIAKYILGSAGIPKNLIEEENLNYRVFRGTTDFVNTYCRTKDDLYKEKIINIRTCPLHLKNMVEKFREVKSDQIFILRKREGPRYKVKFDLDYIKAFRKRYEEEMINTMKEMHEKINEYFNNLAKKLMIEKINKSFVIKEFAKFHFAKFFLEALFDRTAGFLFSCNSPLPMINKEWSDEEIHEKLKPLNAFFEAFKCIIIKELTGGVEKNDYNDLLLLVYLGKRYCLITNDQKLTNKVESSAQHKQIMTFGEAFESLRNITS